ncbi:MAG: peptidoglycan/xylan/chitin deacetylase (PgdA/CDA1 family) [Verrucomicrobiales bacterium]|jgi:peptidoglycan/xylan/chitin deacetylase (PgdA/CDA1 family)
MKLLPPFTITAAWLALVAPACLTACTSVDRQFPWENEVSEEKKEWAESSLKPFETPTLKPPKNRYFSVPGHGPVVAMTFDDGPRPWTMDLLDSLKERNIKATFFVVGQAVATYPEVVKRIVAEGHEIANHTWNHPKNMARMPERSVRKQLQACHDIIVKTTGVVPRVFRPPGGSFSSSQSQWIYKEWDYVNIMWSVDPLDWQRPGAEVIKSRILEGTSDGAIILAHDLHQPTVKAMPATLDALIAEGYQFLRVSELLALDRPEAQLMVIPTRIKQTAAMEIETVSEPKPVDVVRARVVVPQ